MKKLAFVFFVALMFSTTAMALDVAISTQAGWWGQDIANSEMQEVADNVTGASVELFGADAEEALAMWVANHTGDGVPDLLILCGVFPDSIYPGGNAQPDDSLAELFLDDGNTIVNTGDWIFYVNSAGTNNTEAGLQNMMDIPGIAMWGDGTPCVVTAEGQGITPSLQDVPSTRPFFLDQIEGDWAPELILAQSEDGTVADPVIMHNAVTGGRVGIFIQAADTLVDIRGEVLSEWINNWYLPTLGDPAAPGNPEPRNYSADVLRDVVLSWTPGEGAATHDVYFGTDETAVATADRDNSMDVLVSQDQVETTLDMGALAFGTTYYWRIDEVTAEGIITQGSVWSFTTELLAYPVTGVTATSNGTSQEGVGPENTVNGSGLVDGLHSIDTIEMWLTSPAAEGDTYIEFDLGQVVSLHEMKVWNHNSGFEMVLGFGIKDVTVEYSTNGTDWTALGDVTLAQAPGTADYAANTTIGFDGVAAQFVRLTVISAYMPTGQFGLSEVAFTSIPVFATDPMPESGSDEVAVDVILSWLAGRGAVAHELYLSDDEVAVTDGIALIDTITETSFDTSSLSLSKGTTYYWKVNEITGDVNDTTVWEGDVWTFKTEGQFLGLVDVTMPGDMVQGVPNDGNWPEGELPDYAIDDDITTKFLNFGGATGVTGIQVTPSVGPSIVTGLSFTTANDAPERDPVAYEIYGSNESIDGQYELIAAGEIVDFAQEEAWPRFKGNTTDIVFENTTMYDHYQVLLTAVRDPNSANSMQIGEIELLGTPPTDVSSPADPVVGIPNDGDWPAAEYPALATDNDVNTKFLHFQGGNMPTGIQITVAAPSMVTGLAFTTANDAAGRDPVAYELYASADGVTYELIASGDIVDFAGETEWPRFTKNATPIVIANRAKYRHYQVIFPVVRDPGQNLMQIAEVELLGFADEALDVTTPGDAVVGLPNDGDWPAAEYPDLAVDNDVNTKYLHFKGGFTPSGIQVTPVAPSRIIGLALTSANDAAGRDPVTYEIYGSNESIDGPYELIASGDVADFAQEAEWPRFTKNESPISFVNEMVYTHYQILFPTVRDPGQNLMQIAEIELLGFFE